MSLKPYMLSSDMIPNVWPVLEPMVLRSCRASRGMADPVAICHMLHEGSATCFGIGDHNGPRLAIVVIIVQYPVYKAARIVAASGRGYKDAMQFISVLEDWALSQGAVELEGWCRPALARLVRRLGWKHSQSVMTWDLRRRLQ